jgi:hypothetical protein
LSQCTSPGHGASTGRPDRPGAAAALNGAHRRTIRDTELFWELRYDPDKGGGSADDFGEVDIACGGAGTKVQPDKKPDFPYAQWPYSVTVYACAEGAKGQQLANGDPRIVWKDQAAG